MFYYIHAALVNPIGLSPVVNLYLYSTSSPQMDTSSTHSTQERSAFGFQTPFKILRIKVTVNDIFHVLYVNYLL